MVTRETLARTVPHYVAMLLVVFLVLAGLRDVAPGQPFAVELVVVVVTSLAYVSLTRWLGVAPPSWQCDDRD